MGAGQWPQGGGWWGRSMGGPAAWAQAEPQGAAMDWRHRPGAAGAAGQAWQGRATAEKDRPVVDVETPQGEPKEGLAGGDEGHATGNQSAAARQEADPAPKKG